MPPNPPRTDPTRPAHPEALTALDRPYFVPWGRSTIGRLTLLSIVWLAAVAGLVAVTGVPALAWLVAPILVNFVIGTLFFRNPRRQVPADPSVLVAPADGKVTEVETVYQSEYIGAPALKVAIFLSIFDVHVNRAAATGRVEYLRYRPGAFHDARSAECATQNESQSIGCRLGPPESAAGRRALIRQISGAVARRIICPLQEGDDVKRGGLIGMIKYGSRTELYLELPRDGEPDWEAAVRPGDRVRGGSSVILRQRGARRES